MDDAPERALAAIAHELRERGIAFALVGGLAVSVRAEVRFTRDVAVAVVVQSDAELEMLVRDLRTAAFDTLAVVEHEARERLATVRLGSAGGVVVDLVAATCGIEHEIVARSSDMDFPGVGPIPVAIAEDLLAMKVLAMTPVRLQDQLDARSLIATNPGLDLDAARRALELIAERGYEREQNLGAKLDAVLADVRPLNRPS